MNHTTKPCRSNIEKNIIQNSNGVFLNNAIVEVKNNFFYCNQITIIPHMGSLIIENNEFQANFISIAMNGTDCVVRRNSFYSGEIDLEMNYIQTGDFRFCTPAIVFNNFVNSLLVIDTHGDHSTSGIHYSGEGINQEITVDSCFWNSETIFSIKERIHDSDDDLKFPVNVNHFFDTEVDNVGLLE